MDELLGNLVVPPSVSRRFRVETALGCDQQVNYIESPLVTFARIGKAINEGLSHDVYRNQGNGVKPEKTRSSRSVYLPFNRSSCFPEDNSTRPRAPPAVALTASS